MRVCITGHTQGIGKAFAGVFIGNDWEVEGFSRSNGFDISSEQDRQRILKKSHDADVFINNAYHPTGQVDMLQGIMDQWRGTNKIIVNIGSKVIHLPPAEQEYMKDYYNSKKKLDLLASDYFHANPRIMNVVIGSVDTKMSQIYESSKMNPYDVASVIYNLLRIKDNVFVQQVLLEYPGLTLDDIKMK